MPARHPRTWTRGSRTGAFFDHAYAPSPWTLPNFASIYTGHWPLIHQGGRTVRLDTGAIAVQLAPVEYLPALAEILRTEGFQTMAVVNNGYLAPSFGMARGFDVYDLDLPKAGPNQHRSAANTIQRAFELIDAAAEQPFFLVIHLLEPHTSLLSVAALSRVVHGRGGQLELHAPDDGNAAGV